jgi:hypothetical protein
MMIWITGGLISAALLLALIGGIAKRRAEQLRIQEKLRDAFREYAEHLLSDPETRDNVVRLIMTMAKKETSRSFLWSFVGAAIAGRLSDSAGSTAFRMYQDIPDYLKSDYIRALVTFAIGITYNNILLGPLVRRLMFFSVPRQGGTDTSSISPVAPMLEEFSSAA